MTDDIIYRQAVLALPRNITRNMRGEVVEETIDVAAIKELPSAQPSATDTNVGGDLIDRYAAIEAINMKATKWSLLDREGRHVGIGLRNLDVILTLLELPPAPQWIPCSKKLPEMHDAGILKKVGIKQRSKKVYITIEAKRNDGSVERITDDDAELRDGEWYSDALRWLKAAGKKIEVTAWMPYPEPYNPEGDETVCLK